MSLRSIKPPKSIPKKTNKIAIDLSRGENFSKSENYSSIKIEAEIEDIFAKPDYIKFLALQIPRNWHKKMAVFILLAMVFVLPLQAFSYYQDLQDTKTRILSATNEAIENLKNAEFAANNLDLKNATSEFALAQSNFTLAQNEVNALNLLTSELIKIFPEQNRSVKAGVALLEAGEIIAQTGQIMLSTGNQLMSGGNLDNYYGSLVKFNADVEIAIQKFRVAREKIESVNIEDLPEENRAEFSKVLVDLPRIESGLKNILILNRSLLTFLGHEQWQRYLIVFLNNNELRGGGGFMGSFALLDIDRGKIKNLEVPGGGTYDLQGQLVPKIISPEPMHLINARWEFQDANWWPDFPTTAKKIQWFHTSAGGPSVDGVITITATMMEDLLRIFGPIDMPEYDKVITADNFVAEAQNYSALEYDKEENQPKKLIADLAPKLIDRIFTANQEQMIQLFEVLKNGLNQKQFIANFNDTQLQSVVTAFGWDGRIKSTQGDYLSIVHTNLAGGKTDGVIKESIVHTAQVQTDGSVINTVKLTRHHTGVAGQDIFTGVQNNSYVRFYVPLGSTLLSASGFNKPADKLFNQPGEDYQADNDLMSIQTNYSADPLTKTDIYQESGKTVFGNWLQLKPGATQETIIKYKLPFSVAAQNENNFYYSLLAQKQHGSLGSDFSSTLQLNDELKTIAKFPADLPGDEQSVNLSDKLITDKFYGVVLVKK